MDHGKAWGVLTYKGKSGPKLGDSEKVKHKMEFIGDNLKQHSDILRFFCLFVFFYTGNKESEVKEVDKVMYHDWRLVPKYMEQQLKDFQPLPEPPVQYVPFPPLLRAMMLAEHKKAFGRMLAEEPALPLKRDVLLNRDYFTNLEQERQRTEGTAV